MSMFVCRQNVCFFFLFKQKTAYEMRISDWSSDVCSSDLDLFHGNGQVRKPGLGDRTAGADELFAHHELGRRVDRLDRLQKIALQMEDREIGRASCRERVCQYV